MRRADLTIPETSRREVRAVMAEFADQHQFQFAEQIVPAADLGESIQFELRRGNLSITISNVMQAGDRAPEVVGGQFKLDQHFSVIDFRLAYYDMDGTSDPAAIQLLARSFEDKLLSVQGVEIAEIESE